MDQGKQVKVLDGMGVIRSGYTLADPKPDKNGFYKVMDPEGKILKVHKERVSGNPDSRIGEETGSVAIPVGPDILATCPTCGGISAVKDRSGTCPKCGKFEIREMATKPGEDINQLNQTSEPKSREAIDIDQLASVGELWIKEGIPFDDENTTVKSCSLRIGNFYVAFNLYNDTFGKKNQKPPIEQMVAGNTKGLRGIYAVKSVDKWRKKLEGKKYKRINPSGQP